MQVDDNENPGSVSRPADGRVSRPADGSVSRPADGRVSRPADGSVSRPADGSVSRPADGRVSRPADGRVSLSPKSRRIKKLKTARPLDSRVTIGLAFHRWRSLKKKSGMSSDAEVALYLLNTMDQDSTALNSSKVNNQKIKFSKSEVQALIEQEVHKGLVNNEAKMGSLIETLQKASSDLNFEKSLHKLETQLNAVSRKAESAFAYIANLQKQSLPSSPGYEDNSRGAFGETYLETLPQSSEQELERKCAIKTGELIKMIETTTNELKNIRADEELTAAVSDFHEEKLSPAFTSNGFCMETNKLKHLNSDNEDLREKKPPQLLPSFGSFENTAIKEEFNDAQEEENHDRKPHLLEEPKIKKFKGCDTSGHSMPSSDDGQELLVCPALPTLPLPSTLNVEAALHSMPQKVELKLALIRNPTRLSVLWNVMEKDPAAPPMDSYTIFLTMEKVKGSGTFPKWRSYSQLKATSLPMGALIKKYKPGHKVCAAVVGKDIFGRYGPYSEVVTKTMPD